MMSDPLLEGVCECLGEVLDLDPGAIKPADKIIDDLGADSLDLLDLIFHLEQKFSIRIKPRDIERRATEQLGGQPLEVGGVYTEAALKQLRTVMPEVPAAELGQGLRTNELPYRFRVKTFVNLVSRLREEQHG